MSHYLMLHVSLLYYLMFHYFHVALFNVELFDVTLFNVARQRHRSAVTAVKFEHISPHFIVFLLLILNR